MSPSHRGHSHTIRQLLFTAGIITPALFFPVGFLSAQTCTNPPVFQGFASPCPVFSVSPASVSPTGSLGITAAPKPGYDYIYTTAYYAQGSNWIPFTMSGSGTYMPTYSSTQAQGSLNAAILATLPQGTNYVVVWDWLWDQAANCYKGPGFNQCNTGQWRLQTFNVTANPTPTPTPTLTPTPTPTPSPTPSSGGTASNIPCGTQVTTGAAVPKVPPSNYTTFLSTGPNWTDVNLAAGASYTDTDFGGTPAGNPSCTITRMTRGDNLTPVTPSIHSYKYTPINCTDDLELIGSPGINSWKVINIPSGSLYLNVPSTKNTPNGIMHDNNASPLWAHCGHGTDAADSRTLYWHDAGGPKIYNFRVDTVTNTMLHDFSLPGETACGGGPCTQVCWGCSSNGPHQGIVSQDDTTAISALGTNGHWYAFIYDLHNNRFWPGFTPVLSTVNYPLIASYTDHRMVVSYLDATTQRCGFSLYDVTGKFVHNIPDACDQHNEEGLDSSGADVVYFGSGNTIYQNICPHGPGAVKVNVDTLAATCVADTGWGGLHLSVTQDGKWLAMGEYSTYSQKDNCTKAYYNANPSLNWPQYFTRPPNDSLYEEEIVLASTDGSKTYRLTHHRTVVVDNATCNGALGLGGQYDYWATPKTAMSYDGKYIAFTSNFGVGIQVGTGGSYTDEYVLATGL